jgi:hypothetical protein
MPPAKDADPTDAMMAAIAEIETMVFIVLAFCLFKRGMFVS